MKTTKNAKENEELKTKMGQNYELLHYDAACNGNNKENIPRISDIMKSLQMLQVGTLV